jgi:myosin heavy subunit
MNYPDSYFPATNEVIVDFSPAIKRQAEGKKLSSKDINNLPDSDFAYISPGGKKDSEGKTIPRSLRHLPIPDAAHVRNALARLNQTKIPAAAKKSALAKIKSKAKDLGVHVSESDGASDKSKQEKLEKEEYHQDKEEVDSETLKERLKHHKDAVKNLEQEIKKLEKDKKEDVKDVKRESDAASDKQKAAKEKFLEMIQKKKGGDKKDSDKKDSDKKSDDKKSSEKDESKAAKTKKEWDKIDKKELKRDTKKEKEEHEKDAIKDDESKIKKLKKGAPSEKKRAEIHDIKKDEKFDKKNATLTVSTVASTDATAAEYPTMAFKPAPFDGVLESAPYSKLLEPVDWEKLKKELSLNTLWFKKPKAPKVDYRKFLDPHFKP